MDFSDLSHELTKIIEKTIKKNNGIYFTPPTTIMKIINKIEKYMKEVNTILEPSCGSCEFVTNKTITPLKATYSLITINLQINSKLNEKFKIIIDK